MATFAPVAIVGRSCVLPGALSPQELWDLVASGRDALGPVPDGRWRVAPGSLVADPSGDDATDRTWTARGGYVRGFHERFDATGFAVGAAEILALDPLFQWVLHCAREALRDSGPGAGGARVGAVFGNLSFPSASLSRFAESVWSARCGGPRDADREAGAVGGGRGSAVDPRNRFMSGLPALVLERALALGGGAFALDAACASSLYAIKLACDRLHDGSADLMLAGAVNCADDLFIHMGFTALEALSRSGRSRPFHREADGLVPAEGAVFLALRRLEDAIEDGAAIHGVIRAVGLANDGRGVGTLVPSSEGQVRAMRRAYHSGEIDPASVSLVECHATGTAVGDSTEIASLREVFGTLPEPLGIGSLKSNLGHPITAAGAAGLLKVLEAMRAGVRPPTLHADAPIAELAASPFRLLLEPEPWDVPAHVAGGVRRAAVSAFGFGGNNAHLIVDAFDERLHAAPRPSARRERRVSRSAAGATPGGATPVLDAAPPEVAAGDEGRVAIVGVGVATAGCRDRASFTEALFANAGFVAAGADGEREARIHDFEVDAAALGVPPNDLRQILPQQLLALEAARQAASELGALERERTGVVVGMGADAEVARYGARWRWAAAGDRRRTGDAGNGGGRTADAQSAGGRNGDGRSAGGHAAALDGIVSALRPAGVVGTMPNMVANRINRHLDLGGPGFTVSAEERSGLVALELASRALRARELDLVLVGAVDLACEEVHRVAASACVAPESQVPGDAAVALALKRLPDAVRDGDRIYALLDDRDAGAPGPSGAAAAPGAGAAQGGTSSAPAGSHVEIGSLASRWGHAHAASGLLSVVAAVLALHHRRQPDGTPWLAARVRSARVRVSAMDGREAPAFLREHAASTPRPERPAPALHVVVGRDTADVLRALESGRTTTPGEATPVSAAPARLVLVAADDETLRQRAERARSHLLDGAPPGAGVHFRAAPVRGDLAFVFTAAGAAYHGMGRELLAALPELGDRLARRFAGFVEAMAWTLRDPQPSSGIAADPGSGDDRVAPEPTHAQRLWASSCLSQIHADLSLRWLRLSPDAAIGYSSGESNALFALGAWSDMDAMRVAIERSGLYARELAGSFDAVARWWEEAPDDRRDATGGGGQRWEVWSLRAPVDLVRAWIAGEPRVHLSVIHTADDCVIAGDAAGCRRVVGAARGALGAGRCRRLEYDVAAHVPELDAFREPWLEIHRRAVTPVPGVRFYSAGSDQAYAAERETCARALLEQARSTLDFPRLIERAWRDGVRVFVEHGPLAACSGWIRDVLGERAEQAAIVAFDRRGGGVDAVYELAAELVAAGVPVSTTALEERLRPATARAAVEDAPGARRAVRIRLPAHAPPVRLPRPEELATDAVERMEPAPPLPPPPPESSAVPATVAAAAAGAAVAGSETSQWSLHVRELGRAHRQFVEEQARVHQRFLAVRSAIDRSAERLAREAGVLAAAAVDAAPILFAPVRASVAERRAVERAPLERAPVERASVAERAPVESAPVQRVRVERAPIQPTPVARRGTLALPFEREQLLIHASGRISDLFGPEFARQDGYARQVRMPEPPLLLADRVVALDAQPGAPGAGAVWTETDVRADAWYLDRGRMPAGILIESGQADLLLASYMGVDFENRGERVYRLLGCEVTFEGDLPSPGDRLRHEIRIDAHARQQDVRLFFFHSECTVEGRPLLRVRNGRAGFFSDRELAAAEGVLWSPESASPVRDPRLDPPPVSSARTRFAADRVRAFAAGRTWECFGRGFEHARTHTDTPRIPSGNLLLLDAVSELDPSGGPWRRGYLRAETAVAPDQWFFAGHFKNDPCMPGTLMFEACLQAMAFYLAALGFTLERDGWRFQPVCGEPIELRCRGQVTPASRSLVYELFVEELIGGPRPMLYADLVCTVDGRRAFHARRAGLSLVPGWPLESRPELAATAIEREPVAGIDLPGGGRFRFDQRSILACAWGRPSAAFGPMYARFDGPGRVPRLPGPPYLFLSRVTRVTGAIGAMEIGSSVEVEYDVAPDAWYFAENGARTMPYCVLLEAALQPCGWLASYVGCALAVEGEVCFRNLDGTATVESEVLDTAGTLRTRATLTKLSRSAGVIIVAFQVECFVVPPGRSAAAEERRVHVLDTAFGFFPPEALSLENQVGQPTTDEQRALLTQPSAFEVDLRDQPARYFDGSLRLAGGALRMVDRVTGLWPEGGAAGLGTARSERDVDAADWYFKAHFFQDPVQPGSLGIEAMIQTLQFVMLERGMGDGIESPRFEPLELDRPMTWKYRGQVVPRNAKVQVTLEVTAAGTDERGSWAMASASLWCDGIRIYSTERMGMRIVSGATAPRAPAAREPRGDLVLDPVRDVWLGDHRPTWHRPALPLLVVADLLARAVPGPVAALRDVQMKSWIDFAGARRLWTECEARPNGAVLVRLFSSAAAGAERSDGVEVATGWVETGEPPAAPAALPSIAGSTIPDPYASGHLFHGPAFQLMRSGEIHDRGASSVLDAAPRSVPVGRLHPALLDAALHAIPHDRLQVWAPAIPDDAIAYPVRLLELVVHGAIPTRGEVRCEVRFDGFLVEPGLPRFRVQLTAGGRVVVQLLLVEACFPKGALGSAPPLARRAFLRDHVFVDGVSLSRREGGATLLSAAEVEASDWMPGTIEGLYGTRDVETIAIKEHLAVRHRLHPRHLPRALPLSPLAVEVSRQGSEVVVRDAAALAAAGGTLELTSLRGFWNALLGISSHWLGQDLWEGLLQRYVRRVLVVDPEALAALAGRAAIFVGNHQVQIESLLVTSILADLLRTPVVALANAKHRRTWVGWLERALASYPGARDPGSVLHFDPARPDSMFEVVARLRPDLAAGRRALFLHPQGTRSRSCREPVTRLSSFFLDLAIELELALVPVRFAGGLPVEPLDAKLELPIGHAAQDYVVGAPIAAAELRALPYRERVRRVLDALAALGEPIERETPNPGDPDFARRVRQWEEETGAAEIDATLFRILEEAPAPCDETARLLDGARRGVLRVGEDPTSRWIADVARRLYGPRGPRLAGH